jgi:oligopeptide/dipeptide ABC transporter ATP-binding protein
VSIRAQVINLLHEIQRERGVAYVFISHDLSLVRRIARRVAVMYEGAVVEEGETATLFANPRHPYTQALLEVIPVADPRRRAERSHAAKRVAIDGERESAGCAYAPRCPHAMEVCWSEAPRLGDVGDGTRVCCHLHTAAPPAAVTPAGSA